jgi:hypothetical protein
MSPKAAFSRPEESRPAGVRAPCEPNLELQQKRARRAQRWLDPTKASEGRVQSAGGDQARGSAGVLRAKP